MIAVNRQHESVDRKSRLKISQLILVYRQNSEEISGKVLDLHDNGMRIMFDQDLAVGQDIQFKLSTYLEGEGTQFIDIEAKVRWCHKVNDNYNAGLSFEPLNFKSRYRINELIKQLNS